MFKYDRLEELISESGKTKVSLCKKINKCPTYLRDAKKQNTDISGETLRILAEELGTSIEYLTGETNEKKPIPVSEDGLSSEAKEIIRLYDLASPELRSAALAVLKSAEAVDRVSGDSAKEK